jgi:hypothetical protein
MTSPSQTPNAEWNDDFLACREDCRAQGWPEDHPYWVWAWKNTPVEPLSWE